MLYFLFLSGGCLSAYTYIYGDAQEPQVSVHLLLWLWCCIVSCVSVPFQFDLNWLGAAVCT